MARTALVIFQKQLGDTVLLEPALARLAAATGQEVHLWCKPALHPLVELMDSVRAYEGRQRFGSVWVYEKGSKATFRAFLSSAPVKNLRLRLRGTERWYQRLIFSDLQFTPKVNRYFAEWYWEVTDFGDFAFRPPRLRQPPESWEPGFAIPEQFILLNATASEEKKSWRIEAWLKVIESLKETKLPVVFTGSGTAWAQEHISTIQRAMPSGINLAGKTNLKEFLFLTSRAALVLTVDGACSHLAQAFERPTITIFSATNSIKPLTWHYPRERSFALCEQPGEDLAASANQVVQQARHLLQLAQTAPQSR